jgi:hypothetical protein
VFIPPYGLVEFLSISDDDSCMSDLIPAGNFATGLAWSHFTGYLKIILPGNLENFPFMAFILVL